MKNKLILCLIPLVLLSSCKSNEATKGEDASAPYVPESIEDTSVEQEQKFNLYTYNFEKDKFEYTEEVFHGSIEEMIDKLEEKKSLPLNVSVNSFEIVENVVYIDFSEEFADILDWGITQGQASLGCLVDTIIDYYDVEYVSFTVNGEYCETGEMIYNTPVSFIQHCIFYTPDSELTGFNTVSSSYDGTIQGLINVLEKVESFPENVKVNSFEIKENVAYIDLSPEFTVNLDSGTTNESIVIGVLVNTIIKNYDVEKVMFTINGEVCSTDHVTYDEPLLFVEEIS